MEKRKWTTFVLLLIFFVGLSVMLYPALSSYWNTFTQSQAIADYDSLFEDYDEEAVAAILEEAKAYNTELLKLDYPLRDYSQISGYEDILDINGTGMMGYVTIEKIGVELPLYHGTRDSVLAIAIGHLEGSSLPVPGESTHSVVSAHRGLPTARLFTDLDKVEVGDVFTVTVMKEVFTYQVDQIRIVSPTDISELAIAPEENYCTLLTCTPYGINTSRLLVRGTQIETIEHRVIRVTNEGYQVDTMIVTPIVALPILFILMLIVVFKPVKKDDGNDD